MTSLRFTKRLATRTKRKHQICKVFECKVDRSHLSTSTKQLLNKLFQETKWFYNYVLSHDNINDTNCTIKQVPVKVIDHFEDRKFTILQTQHRQALKERTFGSVKALNQLKKQGRKVGKLKFKSEVNSIPLREYGRTYKIDFDNSKIKLAGIKKWIKVKGLEQIKDKEIANATLVKKCNDYFLNITTYQDKEHQPRLYTITGIDFGCETQLTFSNGTKVEFQVQPSKRLKRLDCKLGKNKNLPRSKKKEQLKNKRRKEYLRLTNKRKDIRHKLVNAITTTFEYVCFQDESIHAWHSDNHGKKIQFSGIGGIIEDLKHKSHTPIMIDKFFPSTQLCPNCGNKQKLHLSERTYKCNCGFDMDRDVKSAICIENEAIKQIPMDDREFTAREISTSTFLDKLATVSGIKASKLESLN